MKVLIAISNEDVSPRFDLTVEALITHIEDGAAVKEPRELLLSEPSGDELSGLAVSETVDLVICGGIDEVHYEYLTWKNIRVIEGIIGPWQEALDLLRKNRLDDNTVLPGAASG